MSIALCLEGHQSESFFQGNPGVYEGPQPIVVHLHGFADPSFSDGDPNSWFTPHEAITGSSYVTNKYVYTNGQEATTLWFHDHVLGKCV